MKNIRKVIAIFCLLILYAYFINIYNFPSKIVTHTDSSLDYKLCPFLNISGDVLTSSSDNYKSYELNLSVGDINLKKVNLTVAENIEVVPVGKMIGLRMYTDGVMIVGFSEIEDISGNIVTLGEISELKEGDRIVKINNEEINNIESLRKYINESAGEVLNMEVINSNGKNKNIQVTPIHTGSNEYKLGLWVKDAATGVGTLSFYIPETKKFVALGHGIVDSDTGNLLEIDYGEITTTDIVSITKGIAGNPGEVKGIINSNEIVGAISKNTDFGLFGDIENVSLLGTERESVDIALRDEIEIGEAVILSDIEEQGVKEYKVQIERLYLDNNEDNKSFVVRVTDENLISEAGGIIRGLSGSPILQNGKLIGVITNVLVSNPQVGFGVFADLMLENLVE